MNEERRLVGELVKQVLISRLCVREAILQFPHDTEDKSIHAAYHALVHYEADEDLRLKDPVYKDEQDDYLEFISDTLMNGDNLPKNIIDNYENYYSCANILHEKNTKGFLKSFFRFLNIGDYGKDKI